MRFSCESEVGYVRGGGYVFENTWFNIEVGNILVRIWMLLGAGKQASVMLD
jgi:hypothetical protein